jgi:2-polyprenyl-3-methyl-5-hydroxy-6-metoxy-1,4-benzoquinol methylase
MNQASDAQFTGKYESGGIGARLVEGFYAGVRGLVEPALRSGDTLVEVGCGAGYSTERLRRWLPAGVSICASDIGDTLVAATAHRNPGIPVFRQSAYALAMEDASVDVVVMMEVLEHLDAPERALDELARVARRHVLISTPREPVWRALNMCRGKYLGQWGNTPGHVQHWSRSGLIRLASTRFRVDAVRSPLPWTILLLSPR